MGQCEATVLWRGGNQCGKPHHIHSADAVATNSTFTAATCGQSMGPFSVVSADLVYTFVVRLSDQVFLGIQLLNQFSLYYKDCLNKIIRLINTTAQILQNMLQVK
jgi:hypothetical protein